MDLNEGKIGIVSELDPKTMRVKVVFKDGAQDLTTDWLPVKAMPGSFYMPAEQDQVLVFMDTYLDFGVVVGGVYNTLTVAEADRSADILGLKFPGVEVLINKKTGETKIVLSGAADIKASEFTLTGDLKLNGKLNVSGDTTISGETKTAKITANGVIKSMVDVRSPNVSLNTHQHPSAAVGPPSPPIPTPQP